MTLNGVMAVILRYFSEFGSFRGALRKSSRSLSHLLMSSCSDTVRDSTNTGLPDVEWLELHLGFPTCSHSHCLHCDASCSVFVGIYDSVCEGGL